ncbi:MAG: sugar transferase [Enterocloster bolteae]
MKKYEQYKRLIKFLSGFIVLGMEMLIYWGVWVGFYNDYIELPFFRKGNWLMAAFYGIILLFFGMVYSAFKLGYLKKADIIYSQIVTLICANGLVYLQICLLDRHFVNAWPLTVMTLAQVLMVIVCVSLFYWFYAALFPPRRMLLIYGERSAFGLMEKISSRQDKYKICEMINIDQGLGKIYEKVELYDGVIIGDIPSQIRNQLLKSCFEKGIRTYTLPKISDIIMRGADDIHLFDSPLLLARNNGFSFEQKAIKRVMDIVLSLLGIFIASPLMIITAIAIKLYDGENVIHKQVRLTQGGKEFEVYKFRSMIKDAEKDGIARLSAEGDVRVTPIGKVIRKTRLDELPQLFNILKGEMSLVGPRPERPQIAEEYRAYMPEFDYRLKVKGGLTGYAQIFGKYNTTPYDKLKLDLMYIENYSVWLDLKLIIMTIKIVFMKESTEGVADGQITASLEPETYNGKDKDSSNK